MTYKMYEIINNWMVFNDNFNKPLLDGIFPNDIQKVRFGNSFNQDVSKLPNSLTHLIFGQNFNQDVSQLPNSLTHLTFGWIFNQDVSQLPNSLTHLTFGDCFNQDVSKLPNSITHLIFGDDFNQDVSQLPNSIIYLNFYDYSFKQSLNPYLYHLTSFEINSSHKHKIIIEDRCKNNQHNTTIRNDTLIDLLLKN